MDLEEEGYLEQPHTSAGRVPTEKAYLYYVSQVDATQPPSKADELLILSYLREARESSAHDMLERISRVLSLVSSNLGVVISQPDAKAVLEHIHFVNVGDRRILVVLVSPAQVHNRMIRVEADISQHELEAAASYLNQNYQGWELERIREELTARLAEERTEYDRMAQALKQLNEHGMLANQSASEFFLEGASNLVGQPELADPAKLRELIRALEEKETVVRLLNECIRTEENPPQVVVGLPGRPPLLRHFALIGSTFQLPGQAAGRMAILGPARMPYERAMRAMGYIERMFSQKDAN
jgi:heat-inducible transcriptional repressor